MKKFVALLLTLVLTFSLAACGAEGGDVYKRQALAVAARLPQFNKKLIITQSRYSAKVAFRMSGFFSNADSSKSE